MIIKRKTQIILALIVTSVFFFQNCVTIFKGSSQKIPITSNAQGAKIIVDGEEVGYVPAILKLKKKKSHVIRIEKQCYNPLEIRITRKTSPALSILGNIFWGYVGMIPGAFMSLGEIFDGKQGKARKVVIAGLIIGWGGGILVDFLSGANFTLSPKELNVTLTKIEGKPNIILINAEQFQNIKWIRIKCADSDEEEIVNID